jgi:hypothetical protein
MPLRMHLAKAARATVLQTSTSAAARIAVPEGPVCTAVLYWWLKCERRRQKLRHLLVESESCRSVHRFSEFEDVDSMHYQGEGWIALRSSIGQREMSRGVENECCFRILKSRQFADHRMEEGKWSALGGLEMIHEYTMVDVRVCHLYRCVAGFQARCE